VICKFCLFASLTGLINLMMRFMVLNIFLRSFNEHAPINQTMVRGNQVPFMTQQCQRTAKHAVV